jgi:GT2 family glycosyltransferase
MCGRGSKPFDMPTPIAPDVDALRRRLAQAIETARADLSDLEEENWRVRRELHQVTSSPARKSIFKANRFVRDLLRGVRHPLAASGRLGTQITHRGPIGVVRPVGRRLFLHRTLLRALPILEQSSEARDVGDPVRWIGSIAIHGERHDALLCHPPSRVSFRVFAPSRARVSAACAMVPEIWLDNDGGVLVEMTVSGAGGWRESRSLHLDPARRWPDRRWRRLSIEVPEHAAGSDLTVTLATSLPPRGSMVNAWAVWGDPELRYWRPRADVTRSVRQFVSLARATGLRATLQRIGETRATDMQADLYRRWMAANTPTEPQLAEMRASVDRLEFKPTISVITPVYNTPPQYLRACIESVRRQAYPNWELCLADDGSTSDATRAVLKEYEHDPRIRLTYLERNSQISLASNAAIKSSSGEFIALLDHDDELTPDALYHVVRYLNEHRDADMLYSDEDKLDLVGGRCDPYFKPDWSPEHFLTCMYTCHLMVVRRTLVDEIGGFRAGYEGAQDYDLVLRLMERTPRIHHIPRILYHWRKLPQSAASAGNAKPWALDAGRRALEDYGRRRQLAAEVLPGGADGLFRVKFAIAGEPLVSIVIPTRGRVTEINGRPVDHLATCLRSIEQKTAYPRYEVILVADEQNLPEASARVLETLPHRIVAYRPDGPFNFSHKINTGVRHAEGAHILLLNDDVEVISGEWMTAMLEYSQQAEVGAVGAKLIYPDGRLQHIGVVLGVSGVAAHAFHQHPGTSLGYASSAVCVRNYSAVTAACMMTRREVFDSSGGFDEQLAVDFNDIDYCLRLRSAGLRIVFTPYALLYHHESVSFGPRTQSARELQAMRERWTSELDRDPYYHPALTREFADYRIRV